MQEPTQRGPLDERYHRSLRGFLNARRYQAVMSLVQLRPSDRILDLGCGRGKKSVAYYNRTNPIVGVDRHPPSMLRELGDNFSYVMGDARDLSMFADDSFDVVVSFGLLEHIPDESDVRSIVVEASRLAGRFGHVVPHPWAFLEPHTRMPFFGRWPAAVRAMYLRFVSRGRSPDYWNSLRWRSASELRALFDGTSVQVDRYWYGPILVDYIIHGGRVGDERRRAPAH